MKEERKHVSVTVDAMLWRRLKANATLRGVKMGEMLDLVLEKTVNADGGFLPNLSKTSESEAG